jgi:hypothetical protein
MTTYPERIQMLDQPLGSDLCHQFIRPRRARVSGH